MIVSVARRGTKGQQTVEVSVVAVDRQTAINSVARQLPPGWEVRGSVPAELDRE